MATIIFLVLLALAIMAALFVYSGAVLGIPGNGGRVLVLAALTILAAWQCTTAMAHGDAAWIMANPRYVDRDGVHCCGPSDCRREHATKFRETPAGIEIVTGAGDVVLMPRALVGQGLYPSIDQDWWVCIRGGVVRCVFKPTTGG